MCPAAAHAACATVSLSALCPSSLLQSCQRPRKASSATPAMLTQAPRFDCRRHNFPAISRRRLNGRACWRRGSTKCRASAPAASGPQTNNIHDATSRSCRRIDTSRSRSQIKFELHLLAHAGTSSTHSRKHPRVAHQHRRPRPQTYDEHCAEQAPRSSSLPRTLAAMYGPQALTILSRALSSQLFHVTKFLAEQSPSADLPARSQAQVPDA